MSLMAETGTADHGLINCPGSGTNIKNPVKRGSYAKLNLTDADRLAIYNFCQQSGTRATVRWWNSRCPATPLAETTIRRVRDNFSKAPVAVTNASVSSRRGRPRSVPACVLEELFQFAKGLRTQHKAVTSTILWKKATELCIARCPPNKQLKLTPSWIKYHFCRAGWRRVWVKDSQKFDTQYQLAMRYRFIRNLSKKIQRHNTPACLIMNCDETAVKFSNPLSWTLDEGNSTHVRVAGGQDKRQITCVLACTATGILLPGQLIYEGSTRRCEARADTLPDGLIATHTQSHWANGHTFRHFIRDVIVPHKKSVIQREGFPPMTATLLIMDGWKAHWKPSVLRLLKAHNIKTIRLPAHTTGNLQPLDANGSVNCAFKHNMRKIWSEEQAVSTDETFAPESLALLKEKHVQWTATGAFGELDKHKKLFLCHFFRFFETPKRVNCPFKDHQVDHYAWLAIDWGRRSAVSRSTSKCLRSTKAASCKK